MNAFVAAIGGSLLLANAALAQAPTWSPPPENQRCPSRWGPNDERGSMNRQNPAAVMNAAKLIKTGEVIELGHVLSEKMPFFGTRRFDVHIKRTFMNQPSNRRGSNEEIVISEIGQVGTQFDGFAHQTHENSWYNCFKVDENSTRGGFLKLGVHNVGAIVTRGVLIDVAGLKGVDTLPDTYEITVQDLEDALKKQNTTLQPGDAVIINTGWNKLWAKDNARYVKSCPGIGVKAAEWLIAKEPILLGSDNWPVEVSPNPDPQLSLPVHRRERRASPREHETRRARAEAGLRVCFRDAAPEDPGRLRLDGGADRHPVGAEPRRGWRVGSQGSRAGSG
jgi:kynurenine formamidase